jgi:altronate dehydratase
VKPAIVISARDNVATALEALEAGRVLDVEAARVTVAEPIPRGHKIALRTIRAGDEVIKYGSAIGTATADIAPGAHVHTHNVASDRGRGDRAEDARVAGPRLAEPPEEST